MGSLIPNLWIGGSNPLIEHGLRSPEQDYSASPTGESLALGSELTSENSLKLLTGIFFLALLLL